MRFTICIVIVLWLAFGLVVNLPGYWREIAQTDQFGHSKTDDWRHTVQKIIQADRPITTSSSSVFFYWFYMNSDAFDKVGI